MTLQTKTKEENKDKIVKQSLVFENDPGRRNHSLVGPRHLKNILSLHVASRNLFLIRFGRKVEDSYWSFVSLDG